MTNQFELYSPQATSDKRRYQWFITHFMLRQFGAIAYIMSMAEITNVLMFEIMQAMQLRLDETVRHLKDILHGQIRLRQEVNGLRGDDLRREALQAQMDSRLERIEIRLNLTDA